MFMGAILPLLQSQVSDLDQGPSLEQEPAC
ncbi:MAG: hypothetical protein QOD29_5372, partial [Alphaproteobacteria bacterium]|nr:hypothetical protein [Alphaproteobacteria bacterium]